MYLPEPIPGNDDAHRMHRVEQLWAAADKRLARFLDYGTQCLPTVYANAGGNTDISVIYDWMKAYIQIAEQVAGDGAHDMTIIMCAAAITRLMRQDDRMRADTVLAQLEKEIDT